MPTILISHGFGSNHVISQNQSSNLRAALEAEGYKTRYVQAPIKLTLDDFPVPPDHDYNIYVLYTWWNMMGKHSAVLAEETIKSYVDDDVVGFIGLSQGGSLAGIIAANHNRLIPNLKFAVSYSGFTYPSPWSEEDTSVYDDKVNIPFLSVIGEKDEVVLPELTQKFNDEWVENGEVLRHDGAHVFAEDEKDVKYVIDWIKKQMA